MFELIACNLALLTVAMMTYAWRDARRKAQPSLNERVAYMLWIAAQRGA